MSLLEILSPLLAVIGITLLARAMWLFGRDWRNTVEEPVHIAEYEKLVFRLVCLAALGLVCFVGAWYVNVSLARQDTRAALSCDYSSNAAALSLACRKIDFAIAELAELKQSLNAIEGYGYAHGNRMVGPPPSHSLDRADWEAVADHAMERAATLWPKSQSRDFVDPALIGFSISGVIFGVIFLVGLFLAFAAWKNGDRWALRIAAIGALGALLSGLGAIFGPIHFGEHTAAVPNAPARVTIVRSTPILISERQPLGGRLTAIPIFFDENATAATAKGSSSVGVTIHSEELKLLRRLAEGIFGCGGTKALPVTLIVRGYASSAEFRDEAQSVSDKNNLAVANRRAKVVRDALRQMGKVENNGNADWLKVDALPWSVPEDMIKHRPYNDKTGQPTEFQPQEILNRVSFVELTNLVLCTVK